MGGPIFLHVCQDCKQMCSSGLFTKHKCFQRTWRHGDAAWVCFCCRPSFHVLGDLYMHSVLTKVQCLSNENLYETLSMNQDQDLRRIMKSSISSHIMGSFSLFHTTDTCGILYFPVCHSWAIVKRQHNSG